MKLLAYLYNIPLVSPLETSKGTISQRKGLLIAARWNGFTLYGEAAPLPGYSSESLAEVKKTFLNNREQLEKILEDWEPHNLHEQQLPASLAFAMDSIAFKHRAQKSNQSLSAYLFGQPPPSIPVNAVLPLRSGEAVHRAAQLIDEGYRTIKSKIGVDFQTELKTLEKLRNTYPDLTIRLDANQAWSLEEALKYCDQLGNLDIEYIEEPLSVNTPENWKILSQDCGIPLAIDESQLNVSQWQKLLPYCAYIIIKPMFKGSFKKIFECRKLANSFDNKIVFTTTFESGIGRHVTAILAGGLGDSQTAHGLATGNMLAEDIFTQQNSPSNGFLSYDKRSEDQNIDFDKLPERISIKKLV